MPGRPNVVLFMPDQLRADALGCFGNPVSRTPNIDAIARRGSDPAETTNLAGRLELAAVVDDLRVRLLDWLAETSDVSPWTRDPRFPDLVHGYRDA